MVIFQWEIVGTSTGTMECKFITSQCGYSDMSHNVFQWTRLDGESVKSVKMLCNGYSQMSILMVHVDMKYFVIIFFFGGGYFFAWVCLFVCLSVC